MSCSHRSEKFAHRLASGPTRAFAAVKKLAAAYTEGGIAAADERLAEDAVGLFDTDDARNAIESFLTPAPARQHSRGTDRVPRTGSSLLSRRPIAGCVAVPHHSGDGMGRGR